MRFWFTSKLQLIEEKLKLESEVRHLEKVCTDRYHEISYLNEFIKTIKDGFELEKAEMLEVVKKKNREIVYLKDIVQAKDMIIGKLEGDHERFTNSR